MYTIIYLPGQDGNAVNIKPTRIYIFDTLEGAIEEAETYYRQIPGEYTGISTAAEPIEPDISTWHLHPYGELDDLDFYELDTIATDGEGWLEEDVTYIAVRKAI